MANVTYKENPKILTSLAQFHLYYWLKRFQKYPDDLEKLLNEKDKDLIQKNIKTYHT